MMKPEFDQTAKQDLPILNNDREVMVSMRGLHDKMTEVIALLQSKLDKDDPRIQEICGISLELERTSCRVLGGVGHATCLITPIKKYTRSEQVSVHAQSVPAKGSEPH